MSYSVKQFIKTLPKLTYTLHEFECIANDMSVESKERYTQKSALNILARYSIIDNGLIVLDADNRHATRQYDDIVKDLADKTKVHNSVGCEINYDQSDNENELTESIKTEVVSQEKVELEKEIEKDKPKKITKKATDSPKPKKKTTKKEVVDKKLIAAKIEPTITDEDINIVDDANRTTNLFSKKSYEEPIKKEPISVPPLRETGKKK